MLYKVTLEHSSFIIKKTVQLEAPSNLLAFVTVTNQHQGTGYVITSIKPLFLKSICKSIIKFLCQDVVTIFQTRR